MAKQRRLFGSRTPEAPEVVPGTDPSDRAIRCDICGKRYASVGAASEPPVYVPFRFCALCSGPAHVLIVVWMKLPGTVAGAGTAAVATRMIAAADAGPGADETSLPTTLSSLATELISALREGTAAMGPPPSGPSTASLFGRAAKVLESSGRWSLVQRLIELGPFLVRLPPGEDIVLHERLGELGTAARRGGQTAMVPCILATDMLRDAVLSVVTARLASSPSGAGQPDPATLAKEYGITRLTMSNILASIEEPSSA